MKSVYACLLAAAVAGITVTAAKAKDPDAFRIGAILSMSGASPHYGTVMSRGAGLAVDEINAKGGIDGTKLELVIEDHKSGNTQAAVAGMNRLINITQTPAVLSSFSGPTLAIAPISQDKQVFVLNGGGVSPKMIGVSEYMFHNRSLATDLAGAIVQYAKDRGFTKIAQVAMKSEFGDSTAAATIAAAKRLGLEIVSTEQFAPEAANIDTQIAKIRAAHPELIMNWVTTPQVGLSIKRIRELGMTQPVVVMDWTPEDSKLAGRLADGVEVVTDYFTLTDGNPWGKRLYDSYKAKYGDEPDFYAANYYEAIYVIAELIKRAKQKGGDYWTGARLAEALRDNPTFDSVYGGAMTFQKNNVALKRVGLFRIEDGKQKFQKFLDTK